LFSFGEGSRNQDLVGEGGLTNCPVDGSPPVGWATDNLRVSSWRVAASETSPSPSRSRVRDEGRQPV
jgi:hypothetical protein